MMTTEAPVQPPPPPTPSPPPTPPTGGRVVAALVSTVAGLGLIAGLGGCRSSSDASVDLDSLPSMEVAASNPNWPARPAVAADPADPEPFESTGSDEEIDIITSEDPSALACVVSNGTGPEEFLDPTKDHYESVPDAYLFTAYFTDGTTIDVRVHPEVGTAVDATTRAEQVMVPAGQLPTLLRKEIGRFALRNGDETAIASPMEGISMQTANVDARRSSGRLAETIFHESVHTSLDAYFAYQRSPQWLEAQQADGRFLTTYGREQPDGEDLAESALYAYGVTHYPDRFSPAQRAAIVERIPARIAFFSNVFPVDEPIIEPGPVPAECDG